MAGMSSSGSLQPKMIAIHNGENARSRSRTLTTPISTPIEYRSEFITPAMLQASSASRSRHWDELPLEIKSHILGFLSATDRIRCMCINREFRDLVTGGSLWQTLDTTSFFSKIPARQLLTLIHQASPFVQNLNLRGCSQLRTGTQLRLNNLIQASFEGCRFLTSEALVSLIRQNPRLQALDVTGVSAIDDSVLHTLESCCPSLRSLNISYCRNVSASGIRSLVEQLNRITDLRLAECTLSQDLLFAINRIHGLSRLSLAGCSDLENDNIKDLLYGHLEYGVISPETRVRSPLVHLDISRCSRLTSDCIKYLCWVTPELQKLELHGLDIFDDSAILQFLPSLNRLTHIGLQDCRISDDVLVALSSCIQVRHIQMSHCRRISDVGVLSLVENLPLTYLDLDNTRISDRVLSAIAATPQEMRISICDCIRLSWTGVLSLLVANSSKPQGLKRIKTFYGWQRPVDGHTKRCLQGDLMGAKEIEKEWAAYMMTSSEQVMKTGEGRSKFLDFDESGMKILARERQSTWSCLIM